MTVDVMRVHAPGAWRAHLTNGFEGRPLVERRDARARAALVVPLDIAPRSGEAWFPLVVPDRSAEEQAFPGVLARVRVGGGERNVSATRVWKWVADLAGVDPAPEGQGLTLGLDNVPEGWKIDGRSWELAAGLAVLTSLIDQPLRDALVVSGVLDLGGASGACLPVAARPEKERITQLEASGAGFWAAADSGPPPLDSWLPAGWRARLSEALSVSPTLVGEELREALWKGDQARITHLAPVALAAQSPETRALGLRARGTRALHSGRSADGLRDLQLAQRLVSGHDGPRTFDEQEVDASVGIGLIDQLDPLSAVALLERTLGALDEVPLAYRGQRWRQVALQVAGSLRRAFVASGMPEHALAVHQEWPLGRADLSTERARCLLDLADTLLRLERPKDAMVALESAEASLASMWQANRRKTREFLDIQRARAGALEPPERWRGSGPVWSRFPQPLELAEWVLHAPPVQRDETLASWPLDPEPVKRWVASRLAAQLMSRGESVCWARGVLESLEPFIDDACLGPGAEQAWSAALRGDGRAWVRRVPY